MTLDEFKKQVYHVRKYAIVPSLGRMRIDKTQFMVKGKYKPELLDKYLEEIYNQKYKN